jgi:hypothetical protein
MDTVPLHGPDGLAGEGAAAGADTGTTAPLANAGALVDAIGIAGTAAKLPLLATVATKPELSTDESDLNEIVTMLPLDLNATGKRLPENDAATAPDVEPPLYSFTKSYPDSVENALNCTVIGPVPVTTQTQFTLLA